LAAEAQGSSLDRALAHPLRKRLVVALWHSSEPLTAGRIEDEYLDDEHSDLGTIVYHLRVLERVGVVEAADLPGGPGTGPSSPVRGLVLGGENAGEAVRRLGIADGRDP
jgi:hypothetical protein